MTSIPGSSDVRCTIKYGKGSMISKIGAIWMQRACHCCATGRKWPSCSLEHRLVLTWPPRLLMRKCKHSNNLLILSCGDHEVCSEYSHSLLQAASHCRVCDLTFRSNYPRLVQLMCKRCSIRVRIRPAIEAFQEFSKLEFNYVLQVACRGV
jgi:hypothetical protein